MFEQNSRITSSFAYKLLLIFTIPRKYFILVLDVFTTEKKISSRFKILFTVKWERDENMHFMKSGQHMYVYKVMMYSGNQRLQSVGNNDRRAKRFCSNAMLCISFTWQMVKTRVIRIQVIEGPNVHDQIALCAFYSFLVEVQMNAGYIHATHA